MVVVRRRELVLDDNMPLDVRGGSRTGWMALKIVLR